MYTNNQCMRWILFSSAKQNDFCFVGTKWVIVWYPVRNIQTEPVFKHSLVQFRPTLRLDQDFYKKKNKKNVIYKFIKCNEQLIIDQTNTEWKLFTSSS